MVNEPPEEPDGEGRVARVWESSRTRLMSRTCDWCGHVIRDRDPRRRYCSRAHRQRAYEVRTAARRARPPEEPVREVILEERVKTVLRTYTERVHVPVPTGPPAPGRAREVQEYLEEVAAAVADGRIKSYDHKRVLGGVQAVLDALDAAHPGGLKGLSGRRR